MLIAVFRDLDPTDELHDKVGAARFGRPRIKHLGNVGVVHQRQGLSLGFKPGDHALGVHSRLDDFQGDPPSDRLLLFRHVNHPASALTYLLEQFVMANAVTPFFCHRKHLSSSFWWPLRRRSAKEVACLFVSLYQGFHSASELAVSFASLAQITVALFRWKAQSFREGSNIRVRSTAHFTNRIFCRRPFNLKTACQEELWKRFRRLLPHPAAFGRMKNCPAPKRGVSRTNGLGNPPSVSAKPHSL